MKNKSLICPNCKNKLNTDKNSITYSVRVWETDSHKNFEAQCYSIKCAECGKEFIFKSPIYGRAPKNTMGIFAPFEIECGVQHYINTHLDSIIDIDYNDYLYELELGE